MKKNLMFTFMAFLFVVASYFVFKPAFATKLNSTTLSSRVQQKDGETESEDAQPGPACGVERWEVKTLTDPWVNSNPSVIPDILNSVETTSSEKKFTTTIESLTALPGPSPWPVDDTRLPSEQKVERIEANITEYKLEADRDYHIVITSVKDPSLTMIVESTDPHCITTSDQSANHDLWLLITDVRSKFAHLAPKQPSASIYKLPEPLHVAITGMVFFDKLHDQTGVAKNGVEIHPILNIEPVSDLDSPLGK